MNNKKIVGLAIAVLVVGGIWYFTSNKQVKHGPTGKISEAFRAGIEPLYNRLMENPDSNEPFVVPVQKRDIRYEIANLEPSIETFRFIMAKYEAAKGNEDKLLHIYSILGLINSSDFVTELKTYAVETKDEELFISFAYSLGQARTVEAKKALFDLMRNNKLSTNEQYRRNNNAFDNQGVSALYRNLMDTLNRDDLTWLNIYEKNGTATPAQLLTIKEFQKKLQYEEPGN